MYAFIGVGQGGCGLLDSAFYDKDLFKIAKPIAINSTSKDLANLKHIKRESWLGMSKDKGFIDGITENLEDYVVGGYGQDRNKAKDDAQRQYEDLKQKLFQYLQTRTKKAIEMKVSYAFLMFSLGGGTGSGLAPYIAKILKELGIYVIAVMIIPAKIEGSLSARNAVECVNEIYDYVNSMIFISNEKISYAGKNMEGLFSRYNDYVARSLVDIVEGMTIERIDPSKFEGNPPVIDTKDFITATSFIDINKPGFSCIGRASESVRNLLHYIFPFGGYREIDTIGLLQQSFLKLTCNIENVEKNLCLLRLPHPYLTKESKMINTEIVRTFLLEKTKLNETHFGVSLTKRNLATSTVVLCSRKKPLELVELEDLAQKYK